MLTNLPPTELKMPESPPSHRAVRGVVRVLRKCTAARRVCHDLLSPDGVSDYSGGRLAWSSALSFISLSAGLLSRFFAFGAVSARSSLIRGRSRRLRRP